MGKYGQTAILAMNYIIEGYAKTPNVAWDEASKEIFGEGTSSQTKGCPRNTFLGLCENGKIKGVNAGSYTSSKKNKDYALKACEFLKNNPSLSKEPKLLWAKIMQGQKIKYNQQMDVVCALWDMGLIT